jgi:DNA-binding transcriptional MerR regulator
MADVHDTGYLSIGEVLGLLLEEFPDVTISKIRFLESQGLISPERTPSGYRKFYEPDVELLRVILTEQRQNYLPLRVIKDRLENGEIDPTGEHLRASGNGDEHGEHDDLDELGGTPPDDDRDPTPTDVPATSIAAHPASRHAAQNGHAVPDAAATDPTPDADGAGAQLLPGVLLDRDEFCGMVGMTAAELEQLQSFGIVQPRTTSGEAVYDEDAVAIATSATEFLRAGIDARHLRNWRTSAEREASLFEQIVTPRFRQRNPEARADALQQLRRLDGLGASLRSALTRQALRHHFDG